MERRFTGKGERRVPSPIRLGGGSRRILVKVALDAMGGDYAPEEAVKGALQASRELGVEVVLVGDRARLEEELAKHTIGNLPVSIHPASQVVPMDEHHPADAMRKYRDSSILVATDLVSKGLACAVVSAGNTGASMASALLRLKRIEGVDRPAIATVMPTTSGFCLIVDAGANVDCKPFHLLSFAVMGSVYAERALGLKEPRVGLLNIGEEESKGNELVVKAYPLLKESGLNFIGNVEGKDIPHGAADVVICDGFVGNVVLKLAEGLGSAIVGMIKAEIASNFLARLGGLLMLPALGRLKKKMDYQEYGGALLLGVRGLCVIAHGRSRSKAIKNAIRVAKDAFVGGVIPHIEKGIRDRIVQGSVKC